MVDFEAPNDKELEIMRELYAMEEYESNKAEFKALVPVYKLLAEYETRMLPGDSVRTSIQEFFDYAVLDNIDDENTNKRVLNALKTDPGFREAYMRCSMEHHNLDSQYWAEVHKEWFPEEDLPEYLIED